MNRVVLQIGLDFKNMKVNVDEPITILYVGGNIKQYCITYYDDKNKKQIKWCKALSFKGISL